MFIEIPHACLPGEQPYNILINLERIMWVDPLINQDTETPMGTRFYMNTAGNNGEPTTVDTELDYADVKKLLDNAKGVTSYEKAEKTKDKGSRNRLPGEVDDQET